MFDPSLKNTFVTFGPSHLIAVVIIFSLIVVGVTIFTILLFNFTNITDVFP